MDIVRKRFEAHKSMGQVMHRKAMDYFRQYLIVGGMPQAVQEYVESKDFDRVDRIKRDILTLYRADIVKHATGYEMKVESIFDEIPAGTTVCSELFSSKVFSSTSNNPNSGAWNKTLKDAATPIWEYSFACCLANFRLSPAQ